MAPNDGIVIADSDGATGTALIGGRAYRVSIVGNSTFYSFRRDSTSTIDLSTNAVPWHQQGYYTNITSSSDGDYNEQQARLKAARLRWQRFIHELMAEPREIWRPQRAYRRLAAWTAPLVRRQPCLRAARKNPLPAFIRQVREGLKRQHIRVHRLVWA